MSSMCLLINTNTVMLLGYITIIVNKLLLYLGGFINEKEKIDCILSAAILVTAMFAGCGTKSTPTSGSSAAAKKIVIGFAQIGAESGWRDAETNSVKDIPNNNKDITLKFSDGQQKQENQIKAIRTFIAQKVDVIALAPVVESGWDTVLKEAKDAKIPVVLMDRTIKVSDESLYTTFIGSDFP